MMRSERRNARDTWARQDVREFWLRQEEGDEVPTPPDEPAEPPVREPPDTPVGDPGGPVREPGTRRVPRRA